MSSNNRKNVKHQPNVGGWEGNGVFIEKKKNPKNLI